MTPKVIVTWVVCGALCGCASAPNHSYPNTRDKNLAIHLNLGKMDRSSGKIDVFARINDIAKDCTDQFLGDIALSPGLNPLGLAPGKMVSIVVTVVHRRDFLGRQFTVRQGALLSPMPGRGYEIVIDYVNDMLDFRLYEADGAKRQPLAVVPISACKPS